MHTQEHITQHTRAIVSLAPAQSAYARTSRSARRIAIVLAGMAVSACIWAWVHEPLTNAAAGIVTAATAEAPSTFTSFSRRYSHNGRYTAEVTSVSPDAADTLQAWTIHLARRKRRVLGARIAVDVWMPDSALRSPVRPSVHDLGGGNYRIDRLSLPRAGWWNVALVITARFGTDSVAFNIARPQRTRGTSSAEVPLE